MSKRDLSMLTNQAISHRGYYDDKFPENSKEAFEKAFKFKYAIELDVRLSKDDIVVVFHDDDLKRMCDVDGLVHDKTLAELQTLKLKGIDTRILTLEQTLKLTSGQVPLIIELKDMGNQKDNKLLSKLVGEMLKGYQGQFAIQSFNPQIVGYFKNHYPDIIRGQLVSKLDNYKMSALKRFVLKNLLLIPFNQPDFINSKMNHIPPVLKMWKKSGRVAISYVAKNEKEMIKALFFFDNIIFENFFPSYYEKKLV
jgi:glycerophosphoryl diester phosphodiesterase